MAKKKDGAWKETLLETFSGIITGFVKEHIISTTKEVLDTVKKTIYKTGKTIAEYIFASVILLVGFIYLLIAGVLITKDAFEISLGISFLLWSVLLIVIGILYSAIITKKR